MREFWVSSGHQLTRRTQDGGLAVTDELLLAYFARPELVPPDDACTAEVALHGSLLDAPRRHVGIEEVHAIRDPDARENWRVMLTFRERLLKAPTIEAAYLDLVRNGANVAPLFLNQLVHLVLRNALDRCDDPYTLRSAELFFRPQRASIHTGNLLLADAEIIATHEQELSGSQLVSMLGLMPAIELDVLDDANAWTYWSRSDAFTMVLNIGSDPRSRMGLARAIEAFVHHLLRIEIAVEPVASAHDDDWRWFVGLDAEATRIGNALWAGQSLNEEMRARLIALFRLTIIDVDCVDSGMIYHPVYLLLAMSNDNIVRMKPQNLVTSLPIMDNIGTA